VNKSSPNSIGGVAIAASFRQDFVLHKQVFVPQAQTNDFQKFLTP